ncbi:hypothetical protein HNQ60_002721 [Povalibacter uvarum]|uniref:Uncharacterized protein n=1 Tax=Povalibacter uvarum TaxID=732238 RepID=A0A841HNJ2_9GAMM|nr:hypothetical protein [Povalibacter uvarum]MBB6093840.1 hypothetical protein [Povalibacter uvarum]
MKEILLPVAALLCTSVGSAAADEPMPAAPKEYGWFGAVDEAARTISMDYFGPRDDFDEQFRAIDVVALTMMHGWRAESGFELQLGGGVLVANGTRHEPFSIESVQDSDAVGLLGGGLVRYNLPALPIGHAFIDASIQFLWAERPFPAGGLRGERAGALGWRIRRAAGCVSCCRTRLPAGARIERRRFERFQPRLEWGGIFPRLANGGVREHPSHVVQCANLSSFVIPSHAGIHPFARRSSHPRTFHRAPAAPRRIPIERLSRRP